MCSTTVRGPPSIHSLILIRWYLSIRRLTLATDWRRYDTDADTTGRGLIVLSHRGATLIFGRITSSFDILPNPFNAICCHMGTAVKHLIPDRVKSFIIFDIRAL